MAKTGIEIRGVAKLLRKLNQIGPKAARDAQRKALREASTPILKTAKRLVPVDEGNLKKSLGRKFKAYMRDNVVVAIIGPRVKMGKWSGQHGWLVEHGSGPRARESGGSTGIMPPQPFMRPAWDLHKTEARMIIKRRLAQELEKAMRKK